jgi:hypothetical protein
VEDPVTFACFRSNPTRFAAAGAALLLALSSTPARGQEPRAAAAAEHKEGGEVEHRNEAALIFAGTAEHEGGTFFTLGGEYERRLNEHWAIGGEVEHLFDADRWVVAAPVTYHIGRGFKVFAGSGFERAEAEPEEGAPAEAATPGRETHFLVRIGGGYGFEFAERYSISPALIMDFIHENGNRVRGFVFGVSFGVAF